MPNFDQLMNQFDTSDEEERKALTGILSSHQSITDSSSESGLDNDFYEVVKGIYEERYPEKLEGGKHTKELLTKMEEGSVLGKTQIVSEQAAKAKFSKIAELKEQTEWTFDNFIERDIEKMNQTVKAEVRDTLGLPRETLRDPLKVVEERRRLYEELKHPKPLKKAHNELPPVEIAYRDQARLKNAQQPGALMPLPRVEKMKIPPNTEEGFASTIAGTT